MLPGSLWKPRLHWLLTGFQFWATHAAIVRGRVLAERGQYEEGIARMQQGLAAYRATGAEMTRTSYLAQLAEVYGAVEQPEEGCSLIAEALSVVDDTSERAFEAELYRLKGELTLQSKVESGKSKEEEAEACFLKAIEIALRQQAKSLELRAATSLARLWRQQGKRVEARQMLADVYNWFTEGFDTKDLQEARALLSELGQNAEI